MKQQYANDMVEDLLTMAKPNIVVELKNGQRLAVDDYFHGEDKNGDAIIVLKAK